MGKAGLLLATCVMLLLATNMTALYGTKFIVEPGDVKKVIDQGTDPPQLRVTGSVTLKESPVGSESRTGGGCLIYLSPGARACNADDSECTKPIAVRNSAGRWIQVGERLGYCATRSNFAVPPVPPHANPPPRPRACWYQPKPESCVKRPSPDQPLKEDERLEFTAPIDPPGVKGPVLWRVVSCQNLVNLGCKNRTPNGFVYRYGRILD